MGPRSEVDPGTPPAFEGELDTPHCAVLVWTVDQKAVLKMEVPNARTRIGIWLSHPRWPEKIVIGLG